MKARALQLFAVAAALALAACGVQKSTIHFRNPPGSVLSFQSAEGRDLGRVIFPGDVTLEQLDSPGSQPQLTVSGAIRVNDLVEAAAVPSAARNYLVERDDGVEVKVTGLYQVFAYSASRVDLLTKHDVDIDRAQLIELLSGQPLELAGKTKSGKQVYKLVLGLGG